MLGFVNCEILEVSFFLYSGKLDDTFFTAYRTVSYEQEVADEQIKARIERVGYTVTEIK